MEIAVLYSLTASQNLCVQKQKTNVLGEGIFKKERVMLLTHFPPRSRVTQKEEQFCLLETNKHKHKTKCSYSETGPGLVVPYWRP